MATMNWNIAPGALGGLWKNVIHLFGQWSPDGTEPGIAEVCVAN